MSGDNSRLEKKAGLELLQASQPSHERHALVAVIVMPMMLVNSMAAVVVRPSGIVRSVIWRTPVIAVVAARIVTVVSRISVAVPVCGVTESDPDSSDPD